MDHINDEMSNGATTGPMDVLESLDIVGFIGDIIGKRQAKKIEKALNEALFYAQSNVALTLSDKSVPYEFGVDKSMNIKRYNQAIFKAISDVRKKDDISTAVKARAVRYLESLVYTNIDPAMQKKEMHTTL